MSMNTITTEKPKPTLEQMPSVPEGVSFRLKKVEMVSMPHPYCITPRHVAVAADHFGGMLGAEAIRAAEKRGACCDICRQKGTGILRYDEHENNLTLFISIPAGIRDLNSISGLHAYLFENKPTFESLGIQGFAFPPI